MPWKQDESGTIEVEDGHPVWINAEGEAAPLNPEETLTKLANANSESAGRKRELRKLADELEDYKSKFEGIDPEAAAKAESEIRRLSKKLDAINADGSPDLDALVEKVSSAEEQAKALSLKLEDAEKKLEGANGTIRQLGINSKFTTSKYFTPSNGDKPLTVIPPDVAARYWGEHFEVDGDRVVGKYPDGETIYSKVKPGEPADFDEAIGLLIERSPNKDSILRASGASGSGAGGSGGGSGSTAGKTTSRETFDGWEHAQKQKFINEGGKVVDSS